MADDYLHAIPVADLVVHTVSPECACGPTCQPVERKDGSVEFFYTHHSLDAREKDE